MRQLLFSAQFLLLDLLLRGAAPYHERPSSLLGALGAAALWGGLAGAARWWPARLALALLSATTAVAAASFFWRYRVLFDDEALRSALRYWRDVLPVIAPWLPALAGALAALAAAEWWLLASPRRPLASAALLPAGAALLWLGGVSSPDARLLASPLTLGAAQIARPPAAEGQVAVPEARARRRPPSVILVVGESLRADSYCSSPVEQCPSAPRVNALLPGRIGFSQARSVASFTVVSMAALSTGQPQAIPRDELLRLPTFFELAHAARPPGGEHITTAYWAAHCHPMFERESVRGSVDSYVTLQDLTGGEHWRDDMDNHLFQHFSRNIEALPRPFFLVLQAAGTHAPYAVDEADAPFQPWTHDPSWETLDALSNAYKNSIHKQDKLLAAALAPLVASPAFADTVLLFTSDHAEEFGEHKQIHHGQDVLDSQTHVPLWLDGALTPAQRETLSANSRRFVTHLDVLPTLMDLWGILDDFNLDPFTHGLPGRSLLRSLPPMASPVPLTNCSEAFPCPFQNGGLLLEDTRIEAQAWDPTWRCWGLGQGPERPRPDDDPRCRELRRASRRWFPRLPGGADNRAE